MMAPSAGCTTNAGINDRGERDAYRGSVEQSAGWQALRLAGLVLVVTPHAFVQIDVRQSEPYSNAAAGVDVIVHTPAAHGIHLRTRSEHDFWELTMRVTFKLCGAAVAHHVPCVT